MSAVAQCAEGRGAQSLRFVLQESTVAQLTSQLKEASKALQDSRTAAATASTEAAAAHAAAVQELKKAHTAALEEMVNQALATEVCFVLS